MANVRLTGIVKRFGPLTAVRPMSLDIAEGSFVTLLGPSGCGKTTTLRMIAGLLDPTEGEIAIGGRRINEVPIHKRNLGIVFQNYALFPHRTVFDNIAFGLRHHGVARPQIAPRVAAALDLVQLPHLADRYPRQLSGGQQQRVALARAVVIEPDVLLLDEPLSALDANLREDMRVELKRIQHRLGITTVFVTHDQAEALAMSDRLVVMSEGRVEQTGPPEEVYTTPASEFVARFLGASNIVEGRAGAAEGDSVPIETPGFGRLAVPRARAAGLTGPGPAMLVIRAEKLFVHPAGTPADGAVAVPARIETVDYQGQAARYFLRLGEMQLQAINMIDTRPHAEGAEVSVHLDPRHVAALPGGRA